MRGASSLGGDGEEMKLYHYSSEDWEFDPTWDYEKHKDFNVARGMHGYKPSGLWLSDDSDTCGWAAWCLSEEFRVRAVRKTFYVNMDRILRLDSYESIGRFTSKYEIKPHSAGRLLIDWEAVQRSYAGILITPYCFQARYEFHWYYGWDCASACIWDLTQVKEVTNFQAYIKKQARAQVEITK